MLIYTSTIHEQHELLGNLLEFRSPETQWHPAGVAALSKNRFYGSNIMFINGDNVPMIDEHSCFKTQDRDISKYIDESSEYILVAKFLSTTSVRYYNLMNNDRVKITRNF